MNSALNFEHDNCGTGAIVNIDNVKSHETVLQGLEALKNMAHRGGVGKDKKDGDGAGILCEIPHDFFSLELQRVNINLPDYGKYAVAVLFGVNAHEIFNRILLLLDIKVLYVRNVPITRQVLGIKSKESIPEITQVFIDMSHIKEKEIKKQLFDIKQRFERKKSGYLVSLSTQTIVYKGMLTALNIERFYPDFQNPLFKTRYILFHVRYSTNTSPSWEKAHPYRILSHNGEINTIYSNTFWANCDIASKSGEFIVNAIDQSGSDSMRLDSYIDYLLTKEFELPEIMTSLIPIAWEHNHSLSVNQKKFYEQKAVDFESWDGPANVTFCDGNYVGALLDRNGLRPSRYVITSNNQLILASEIGVLRQLDQLNIIKRGKLNAGEMLVIDLKENKLLNHVEVTSKYMKKLSTKIIKVENKKEFSSKLTNEALILHQQKVHFTEDENKYIFENMMQYGDDAIGSMGNDISIPALSEYPQHFANYFRQLFAQVTNPPLDVLREQEITSTTVYVGRKTRDSLASDRKIISLNSPIIYQNELKQLISLFKDEVFSISTCVQNTETFAEKLNNIKRQLEILPSDTKIILLTDISIPQGLNLPIHLTISWVNKCLSQLNLRQNVTLIVESAEIFTSHHAALALSLGCEVIYPYLAYEVAFSTMKDEGVENIQKALTKNILKICSKMGISTVQSYINSNLFEAFSISTEITEKYMISMPNSISGVTLDKIEFDYRKVLNNENSDTLIKTGKYMHRRGLDRHIFDQTAVKLLHESLENNDFNQYLQYSKHVNTTLETTTIRGSFNLKRAECTNEAPVENCSSIISKFRIGAMSYGALSKEAHTVMAVAMNELGGMSNSGEGGEEKERLNSKSNSAIKQVASGRFGVDFDYLISASEIQIKMGQGAKPGEGGQLEAKKVSKEIASARNSTQNTKLISPPPHHDIYSIEDLEQLILDLKSINETAKISVKLASKSGVGTIAAGVVKARAQKIIISGSDGGTGAALRNSIFHTGVPWEIGLTETHQTLIKNNLRDQVKLEVDGKLVSARDIIIAAILGADEFAFGTLPLVSIGCIMARVCHKNTCPRGIATQDENLRKKFRGQVKHIKRLMNFLAREVQNYLMFLGVPSLEALKGRTDLLDESTTIFNFRNLLTPTQSSSIVYEPFNFSESLDDQIIFKQVLTNSNKLIRINNTDRSTLARTAYLCYKHNILTLPEFNFEGVAGQSFGTFIPENFIVTLTGETNDFVGKGLSGGSITIKNKHTKTELIAGNVAFFGATSGKGIIFGKAGERFAVRNSGAYLVAYGIGNHGCEYMTGGCVLIINEIGRNFAAGMTGGVAFIPRKKAHNVNGESVYIKEIKSENLQQFNMLARMSDHSDIAYQDYLAVIPK